MPDINLAEMFAQGQGNGFSQRTPLRPLAPNPVAQALPAVGGKPGAGTASVGGIQEAMAKRGSTIMAKYSKHVKTGGALSQALSSAWPMAVGGLAGVGLPYLLDNNPSQGTVLGSTAAGTALGGLASHLKTLSGAKKQRKQLKSKKQEELTEQERRDLDVLDDLAAGTVGGSQEAMAKRSFDFSELLKNKAIRNALIGGVGGLGGGALVDALMPNRASDEKDRWKLPLMGALAGAGAGGFSGVLEQGGLAPKEPGKWTEMPWFGGAAQPTELSMPSKTASQDNEAARVSSAGESSGVKFKHDDEGHLTGASAFDSLDGYMKKAGLNSFQAQFFTNLIEKGMDESMIRATVKTASDKFGGEVTEELNDGLEKLGAGFWKSLWPVAKGVGSYAGKKLGVNKLWGGAKAIANNARQQGTKATVNASKVQGAKQSVKDRAANAVEANLKVPLKDPAVVGGVSGIPRTVQNAKAMATQGHGGNVREMFTPAGFKGGLRETVAQGHNAVKPLYSGGNVTRNLATGGLHATFNPATGFAASPTMYMNEDGGIDWSKAGLNLAGNLAGARFSPTRNWMNSSMTGQYGGYGAGLTANVVGDVTGNETLSNVDAGALSDFGYGVGGLASLGPGSKNTSELYSMFGKKPPRLTLPKFKNGKPNPAYANLPWKSKLKNQAMSKIQNNSMLENALALEPTNVATRLALNTAVKHPVLAGIPLVAAATVPGTLDYMSSTPEYGVSAEVTADREAATEAAASGETEQATPEATAETQAKVEQHAATAPEGFFETLQQFAIDTGGSVLEWVSEMFGPATANFLSENWVSLLAVPAGAGLGAMLGGTGGAVLGALAGPLVAALAQQSGMFGGAAADTPPAAGDRIEGDNLQDAGLVGPAAGNQYPDGSGPGRMDPDVQNKLWQQVVARVHDQNPKNTKAINDYVNIAGIGNDPVVTREAFLQKFATKEEWQEALSSTEGYVAPAPAASMPEYLDTDGNGKVSDEEGTQLLTDSESKSKLLALPLDHQKYLIGRLPPEQQKSIKTLAAMWDPDAGEGQELSDIVLATAKLQGLSRSEARGLVQAYRYEGEDYAAAAEAAEAAAPAPAAPAPAEAAAPAPAEVAEVAVPAEAAAPAPAEVAEVAVPAEVAEVAAPAEEAEVAAPAAPPVSAAAAEAATRLKQFTNKRTEISAAGGTMPDGRGGTWSADDAGGLTLTESNGTITVWDANGKRQNQ